VQCEVIDTEEDATKYSDTTHSDMDEMMSKGDKAKSSQDDAGEVCVSRRTYI
jgi:hypothetical protein